MAAQASVAANRGIAIGRPIVMLPVRDYAEAHDGLVTQLTELLGLTTQVPKLVDEDRARRWEEIAARPGDPDSEMIDIYEGESGAEEGWGFADETRTILMAAIVTAWEKLFGIVSIDNCSSTHSDTTCRKQPSFVRS